MSIQQIRLFGDPVLVTPASPVVDFDKELRKLVSDLTDTMIAAPGAGFAAVTVGVRFFSKSQNSNAKNVYGRHMKNVCSTYTYISYSKQFIV